MNRGCPSLPALRPAVWWKRLWQLKIPSKIKIFAWKSCRGILPTMQFLTNRGISEAGLCPLCKDGFETMDHTLWSCERVSVCWRNCPFFDDLCNLKGGGFLDRLAWLESVFDLECVAVFVTAAWFLRFARNQFLFSGYQLWQGDVWERAVDFLAVVKSSCVQDAPVFSMVKSVCRWSVPPLGFFKINVDAAVVAGKGCFSGGMVVRDAFGVVLDAAALVFSGLFSVEVSEAKAILAGLSLAVEKGWFSLIIESDALNVVNLCNGVSFSLREVDNIVFNIKSLLSGLQDVQVVFVPGVCNSVAHNIACWALGLENSVFLG
ncbi:hypothetical protein ACOSP7_006837 [Xanthoceras sorbifolium]